MEGSKLLSVTPSSNDPINPEQVQEVCGPSRPKTSIDEEEEVSSDSQDEEEEDQDLVRLEGQKKSNYPTSDTLVLSKLSRNTNWPGHLIVGYTHKRKRPEFSFESSETEYSLEPQVSLSIVSLEFEDFCQCDGSDSVDWFGEVIILLSSDSESDVEIIED